MGKLIVRVPIISPFSQKVHLFTSLYGFLKEMTGIRNIVILSLAQVSTHLMLLDSVWSSERVHTSQGSTQTLVWDIKKYIYLLDDNIDLSSTNGQLHFLNKKNELIIAQYQTIYFYRNWIRELTLE